MAVITIEDSGLECLLNIVNECHSQIQEYDYIFYIIVLNYVYLSFSFAFLALN